MKWETPRVLVQSFEPNEYVASCWGVGCSIVGSDKWPTYNTVTSGGGHHGGEVTYVENNTHSANACGLSTSQFIRTDASNTAIGMYEYSASQNKNLECTLYTDDNYNVLGDYSTVSTGDVIYWTTSASDGRIWHHKGTVEASYPGHPNRS